MASTACLDFVPIVDRTADGIRNLLFGLGVGKDCRCHWEIQVVDRAARAKREVTMECDQVGVVAHGCEKAVVAGNAAVSTAHDD